MIDTTCCIYSNYANLNVKDELARIEGVGEAGLFGARASSVCASG